METPFLDHVRHSLMIDRNKDVIIEKLLSLTLEIVCLLAGEDYVVVRRSADRCCEAQSLITGGSPPPLVAEENPTRRTPEPAKNVLTDADKLPIKTEDAEVLAWDHLVEQKDAVVVSRPEQSRSADSSPVHQRVLEPQVTAHRDSTDLKEDSIPAPHSAESSPRNCRTPLCSQECQAEPLGDGRIHQRCKEEEDTAVPDDVGSGKDDSTDHQEQRRDPVCSEEDNEMIPQECQSDVKNGIFHQPCKEEDSPDYINSDKSAKRKCYSVEYKKGIVEESWGKNLPAFCKEKMLSVRLVQKWRAVYRNLSQQVDNGNAKKRKCGSGRQPFFSELEDLICEWVVDRRAKALGVNRAQIQEFALAMAPQFGIAPEEFKASQRWLDSFLQRSELSLRRSTTLFRLEDAEVIKRALAFKSLIDDADFSKYNLSNMIAMDETAVFMGQTSSEQRGASSAYIPSTAYEGARVTCILAVRLDGTKVPPLIISKGKKDTIERVSGIYILETEKAWATQAVIRKWVDLILPLGMRGGQRGLLVWDAAGTHRAKDMKTFLHKRKIDQIMIPAGMTAYLQILDIAINKPFKDNLRTEMNDYIENRMERNQRGNVVKPKLEEVVTWVKNSWERITDSCVADALRAGYLDKKSSFKDTAVARHERFGPKILREMEGQEIQQEIPGSDVYDDVPEDDDMTVME